MHSTGHPEAEAWHEAGHAVVARLLGGRVRGVTLESDRDGLEGHAAIEWRPRDVRDLASLSGRTALAGPLAELRFRGEGGLEDLGVIAVWKSDWDAVEQAAEQFETNLEARAAVIPRWVSEVRAMVGEPAVEERIARVADALDAHGTLDENLFEACLG